MKFCASHWEALKEEIKRRKLWHLVPKDTMDLEEMFQQPPEIRDKDPLLTSVMALSYTAIRCGGTYLNDKDENGNHYCPLCEANKHLAPDEGEAWINACVEAQVRRATKEGLTLN